MNFPGVRLYENPILTRELRTRMRGARAFWVLFAYLAVLSTILFATYASWSSYRSGGSYGSFRVGREFYYTLFVVKALLVAVITPALTAGGVSIEKEQRTFDLLTISLLPRTAVVVGKLTSALAFVALLLTASLPLVSIGFLLGGVSPDEVAISYGLLLVCAFVYGAIGLACSAVSKNTTSATVTTYGAIALLFFATLPFATSVFGGMITGNQSAGGLKALNPVGAVLAGTQNETYFGVVVPAWVTAVVVNGLLGVILTQVAVHRLDWPRTDRSGLLRVLVTVFTGLIALAVAGTLLPANSPGWFQDIGVAVCIPLIGLSGLLPLFATADSLPETNILSALFSPKRLGKGEAPSGLLYVLLLTLLTFGIFYLGQKGGRTPAAAVIGMGRTLPASTAMNEHLANIVAAFVLILAAIWAVGTFGLLLTALLRNRAAAQGALAGMALCVYLLPFAYVMSLPTGGNGNRSPLNVLTLVSPLVAIRDSTREGQDFMVDHFGPVVTDVELKRLRAAKKPIPTSNWHGIATGVYGIAGIIFLLGAEGVRRRIRA